MSTNGKHINQGLNTFVMVFMYRLGDIFINKYLEISTLKYSLLARDVGQQSVVSAKAFMHTLFHVCIGVSTSTSENDMNNHP